MISALWSQNCSGQPQPSLAELRELENALRPYYEVLFNSPGVLAVQSAGINVTEDTHVLDSNLPIDGVIGAEQPASAGE